MSAYSIARLDLGDGDHNDEIGRTIFETSTNRELVHDDDGSFAREAAQSVGVDARLDWKVVEDLVLGSYRLVALERMIRALDAGAATR